MSCERKSFQESKTVFTSLLYFVGPGFSLIILWRPSLPVGVGFLDFHIAILAAWSFFFALIWTSQVLFSAGSSICVKFVSSNALLMEWTNWFHSGVFLGRTGMSSGSDSCSSSLLGLGFTWLGSGSSYSSSSVPLSASISDWRSDILSFISSNAWNNSSSFVMQ